MPRATLDEYKAGYRRLPSGERQKIWRPSVYRLDWDGSRFAWVSLVRSADLADLPSSTAPTCGPSARDTREPCDMAVAVADAGARPSAPRPSPASPCADLGGWAVAA